MIRDAVAGRLWWKRRAALRSLIEPETMSGFLKGSLCQ
jgi:hypothetical protein